MYGGMKEKSRQEEVGSSKTLDYSHYAMRINHKANDQN